MKKVKIFSVCFLVSLLGMAIIATVLQASEKEYKITFEEFEKAKAFFDDPRPYYKDLSFKKLMSPEVYAKLTFDVEAMKKLWAECVGFKAPEVVGKIAPEITPGKYTYKDKEKFPQLKDLMIPDHYRQFNAGGRPHVGNFPEITVVPTRQYYWSLPIAEATNKYMGRTKLDAQGYIDYDSYVAGIPFPQPSGPFKAQQIIFNYEKRYYMGESYFVLQEYKGFNKRLEIDNESLIDWWDLRLNGRVLMEPYGWFDERARVNKEGEATLLRWLAPRDSFGNVFSILRYLYRDVFDSFHFYINVLRRVRKMSATDTQDPVGGQDIIFEDKEGFFQKLTPKRYPYKFEVIADREFLAPSPTDGSIYVSSKGREFHNLQFERRPVYVVKLTQMDKNYVYSQRILYIDKETFLVINTENYDQKGRLYRSLTPFQYFNPEMGMFVASWVIFLDHVDLHSSIAKFYTLPATWIAREHVDHGALIKKGK